VFSVEDATEKLTDGMLVEVDGTAGTVTVLADDRTPLPAIALQS
jgi:phosphohistidine swiveling domain-containing protein